jgi:uncharacterized protein (TIGR02391 family)
MASVLQQLVPDIDALLAMAPEELAYVMLDWINRNHRNENFRIEYFTRDNRVPDPNQISDNRWRSDEVELAAYEAWQWLVVNILIIPGDNNWCVLSRRGKEITTRARFENYKIAAAFPKSLLHPSISERVWLNLARGEYETAVFSSMKAVEEAVREACNFGPTDLGVDLMRKAFHKDNGPLTDLKEPVAERESLSNLFAGAIGSYKNPISHRTVTVTDHQEAQEIVMLASHLLRIVDARKNLPRP